MLMGISTDRSTLRHQQVGHVVGEVGGCLALDGQRQVALEDEYERNFFAVWMEPLAQRCFLLALEGIHVHRHLGGMTSGRNTNCQPLS